MTQEEKRAFYTSAAWAHARQRILIRDHYWCRVCKRRKANTVHHIVPLEECPEKALDEDNLEAICPVCHNREHPEKGRARRYIKPVPVPKPENKKLRVIAL